MKAVPPGATDITLSLSPVQWDSGWEIWRAPSVTRRFWSTLSLDELTAFYDEVALSSGWKEAPHPSDAPAHSWTKSYPEGASAEIYDFGPPPPTDSVHHGFLYEVDDGADPITN